MGVLSPSGFVVSVDELFHARGVLGGNPTLNPAAAPVPAGGLAAPDSAILALPPAERPAAGDPVGAALETRNSAAHPASGNGKDGSAGAGGGSGSAGGGAFQPYSGASRSGMQGGGGVGCDKAANGGYVLFAAAGGGGGAPQPVDVAGLMQSIPVGGFCGAAEAAAAAPAVFLNPAALQALASTALLPARSLAAEPPSPYAGNPSVGGCAAPAPAGAAPRDLLSLADAAADTEAERGDGAGARGAVGGDGGAGAPVRSSAGSELAAGATGGGQAWPVDVMALLGNPALLARNPGLATLLVSAVGAPLYQLAQSFANPGANPAGSLGVKVLPARGGAACVAAAGAGGEGPGSGGGVLMGEAGASTTAAAVPAAARESSEDPQSPSPTAFKENEGRLQQAAAAVGALLGARATGVGLGQGEQQLAGGCSGVAGLGLGQGDSKEPAEALFSPSQYLLKECRQGFY